MPMNQNAPVGGTTFPSRSANRSAVYKVKLRSTSPFSIEVNVKSLHGADWIPLAAGESEIFRVNGGIKEIKVRGVGGTATGVDVYAVGNI